MTDNLKSVSGAVAYHACPMRNKSAILLLYIPVDEPLFVHAHAHAHAGYPCRRARPCKWQMESDETFTFTASALEASSITISAVWKSAEVSGRR